MHKELGIDLGAYTLLVSTAEEGIIMAEDCVLAVERDSNHVVSCGAKAVSDTAAAENALRLYHPLRGGLLSDHDATREMLSFAIHSTCGNAIIKPRVLIGVPFSFSEEEENLLEWMSARAGARETFLVYSPLAAMVGLGMTMETTAMIVDIGASATGLMITAGGKIIYKNTAPVGGNSFNEALLSYLENRHRLQINHRSAEQIKQKIGTVWSNEEKTLQVRGKSSETGEITTLTLSSRDMLDAFEEPTARILAIICEAVSQIPTAYVSDIFHRGILLCGGGSCLDGLDKMISGVSGVNTRVVGNPKEVVAIGLSKILANLPTSMKNEKTNVSQRCMELSF